MFRLRKRAVQSILSVVFSSLLMVLSVGTAFTPAAQATLNATALGQAMASMQSVYYWLQQDSGGLQATVTARSHLTSLGYASVEPVLKADLPAPAGVTNSQVSQLFTDLTTTTLTGPTGVLGDQTLVNSLLGPDVTTVQNLLGQNVTLSDLVDYFSYAQSTGVQDAVKNLGGSNPQSYLKSIFVTTSGMPAIANSTSLQQLLSAALSDSSNPEYSTVYGSLTKIGWSVSAIAKAELDIDQAQVGTSVVDPNYAAEVALLKAAIRSQAHFTGSGLSAPSFGVVETGPESFSLTTGNTATGKIQVAGVDVTQDLANVAYTGDMTASISGDTLTVTPGSSAGSGTVTVSYSGNGTDWVYKADITVSSSSTGGSSGTTTTPTTTQANTTAQTATSTTLSQLQSGTITATQAATQLSQTISSLSGVTLTSDTSSALTSAIQTVLAKAATVPATGLTSTTSASGATTVAVSDSAITATLASAASVASSLNTSLQQVGLTSIVPTTTPHVVIAAPAAANGATTNVQITATGLAAVNKAGAQLVVQTPQATFTAPANFVAPSSGVFQVSVNQTTGSAAQNIATQLSGQSAGTSVNAVSSVVQVSTSFVDTTTGNSTPVTTFSQPVTLSIPYQPKSVTDPNLLTVMTSESPNGPWQQVASPQMQVNTTSGQVTFVTSHNSYYLVTQYSKTFTDVPSGYWAKEDIQIMAARGVLRGMTATTFVPEGSVTRAQFVTMLDRVLGLSPVTVTNFADVPADAWYAGYVGAAYKAGLVDGYGATTFGPGDTLTREQAAVMLARVVTLKTKAAALTSAQVQSQLSTFTDQGQVDSWAQQGVALMLKDKIMQGMGAGIFSPLGVGTRAQTAVMMYQALPEM